MTYRELYLQCRKDLAAAGIDSPENDGAALVLHFFGLDRPGMAIHAFDSPPPLREKAFLEAVRERAKRRPLQYILGQWEFMGLILKVGEGVLVPREDTAVLVEALAKKLSTSRTLTGLDLCSGTGAAALGLCSLLPQAHITCIELSPIAFSYLDKNIQMYPEYDIQAVLGDILLSETLKAFTPKSLDFIISNPPYISADELPKLQPEVQREPALALNGGRDGLLFYNAIADLWLPLIKSGGILAVEIGDTQGNEVSRIFQEHGLRHIEIHRDWAHLHRAVTGICL